jgi:hypothetical protein
VHSFLIAATAVISSVPVFSEAATVAAPDVSALAYAREIVMRTQPDEHERDAQEARSRIRLEQWREAVTARYTDAGVRQIVSAFIDGLPARLRPISEKYRAMTREALIQAYARAFSLEELRKITDFVRTDAGIHYFTRSSAILADPAVAAANDAYGAEMLKAMTASQSEMEAQAQAYLAKHPEANPK